jgi:RNA 3'-phosphate cyclase
VLYEVDGSQKSGSGTILRLAVALAAIRGQPLHIFNIRHNRPQPGLKPQHLEAVLTAAKLCNAQTTGAMLNSRELWFTPNAIRGGILEAEIGTAGNIPMLLMTILPICVFAKDAIKLHVVKGGTDTSNAPTINYIRNVFLPILRKMGVDASTTVHRYGYYPKGNGEVTLAVNPTQRLRSIRQVAFGQLMTVKGISVCTFLADGRVAERQAKAANEYLHGRGLAADIQIVNDESNPIQKGSSIALWAETDSGVFLGGDAIGMRGKMSEVVGREAAERLYAEVSVQPTVDLHLADMLVPYMALAEGNSIVLARGISDHLETNIWLAEKMLGSRFTIKKTSRLFRIEKEG